MPASAEGLRYPHQPFRWLVGQVFCWALLFAPIALLRRSVRQPSLPYMSDQWLLSHQREFNRVDY